MGSAGGFGKKCRHGRGKPSERARMRAWRACGCAWYGDLYVSGVRRFVKLTNDENESRAMLARLVAERAEGKLKLAEPRERGSGVETVAKAWLASVEAENPPPRPATLNAYRSRVKVIAGWFGAVSIGRVTEGDVEDFLADVDSSYSANYARDIRTTLGHVMAYAVRQGHIGSSPMPTGRRKRRAGNGSTERLTIEEAERVIAALNEPCRTMAELALLTGLRRGELLGLRTRHVDISGARLRLVEQVTEHGRGPLKTPTSERVVSLSPRAVELVKPLLGEPAAPLFEVSYWTAGVEMREAMKRAEVYREGRGWHSFRHANTALREMAGESIRSAAAALGHGSEFARTMSYGWSAESTPAAPLDSARDALASRSG